MPSWSYRGSRESSPIRSTWPHPPSSMTSLSSSSWMPGLRRPSGPRMPLLCLAMRRYTSDGTLRGAKGQTFLALTCSCQLSLPPTSVCTHRYRIVFKHTLIHRHIFARLHMQTYCRHTHSITHTGSVWIPILAFYILKLHTHFGIWSSRIHSSFLTCLTTTANQINWRAIPKWNGVSQFNCALDDSFKVVFFTFYILLNIFFCILFNTLLWVFWNGHSFYFLQILFIRLICVFRELSVSNVSGTLHHSVVS